QRQLVVTLGLERGDVLRSDVVDRELISAPERQVVVVTEALHLGDVLGARHEVEETGAAAIAERAFEGERSRLTPHLELDSRNGEVLVVGWETGQLLDGVGLAHAPVAVPAVPVPVARGR